MAAPTATPLATPTGQSSSKSHHGAVLLIAGCTGGMGSILLNHITSSTVYKGRPIALLIALDYFPDTSGPATLNSSLREHCRFETLVMFVLCHAPRFASNCLRLWLDCRHWDAARISSTTEVAHRIDQATDIIDAALITTGLGFHGNLGDLSLEESDKTLQRLMQVNAIGPSLLSQYCAQKMQAAATSGITTEAPILLVLSSYSGVVGLAHRAAYCSSKFALNGFLESLVLRPTRPPTLLFQQHYCPDTPLCCAARRVPRTATGTGLPNLGLDGLSCQLEERFGSTRGKYKGN